MSLPTEEALASAKRLGADWGAAKVRGDEEHAAALTNAVAEGISGSKPEPPDPPDPPEPGETETPVALQAWTRGDITFDFKGKLTDVYTSLTGDPLVVGAIDVSVNARCEDTPSPKDSPDPTRPQTALVFEDSETTYNVSLASPAGPVPLGLRRLAARELPATVLRPRLSQAEVLTSARTAPPKGFFRPPYCGPAQDVKWDVSSIQWDRLPSVENFGTPSTGIFFGGGTSGRKSVPPQEFYHRGPMIEHVPDWPGRELHALQNGPMDGKDIADAVGVCSLLSMTKGIPDEVKLPCVYGLIQYGIDLMGVIKDGGHNNFLCGGQHHMGRFWPVLYAGILLDDQEMQNVMFRTPRVAFNEIDQTFIVTQEDVALGYGGYTTAMIDTPEWGNQHKKLAGPVGFLIGRQQDDHRWVFTAAEQIAEKDKWAHVKYRRDTWPHVWGEVLSMQLMGAEHLVNHPPLFGYSDRYFAREQGAGATQPWTVQMWQGHRKAA